MNIYSETGALSTVVHKRTPEETRAWRLKQAARYEKLAEESKDGYNPERFVQLFTDMAAEWRRRADEVETSDR